MKIKHGLAAAAALAFLFLTGAQTFAASPGRVSYQGTLRKNGVLFSGTAAMEFRLTNADGSVVYWTSGSTDVAVSTGLFRYGLGSPNEVDFGNIAWKEITPYVQMNLDGGWLPREPLYTSVYSLHAKTAESSTGTFTVNGGDLRLNASSGSKGIYFPDGTAQYSAPGWAVTGSYTSFAGGAGVGTLTPATRLDVQAAGGDNYVQFWRNSAGVIKATMTAAGLLYADGSQLSNLPAGADNMGNHTATTALLMANFPINNVSSITANGQITTYSSVTVAAALGLGVPRVRLAGSVELSSYSAGGLYISSNVTLASGGRYFGNGSMLSGVNDSLGNHIATQTLDMAGNQLLNVSTVVVTRALWFNSNVEISSAAGAYSGVYISTNVNLAAGAKYYGDGSGLTGLVGVDNLGNHIMTQSLVTGANWISFDGSPTGINMDALGNVGFGQAAGSASLDLRGAGGTYVQIWRSNAGVIRASMTASGAFYADGSQLRNVPAGGTATQALNMASFDIANVSTVTVSSITSAGVGVVFSTNVLVMNGRLGINTSLPQESLDVNGSFKSSSLSGAGNQCVYADNNGRLLLSGGGLCGSASGLDNLGNHTMLSNLITGSNWISFDGSNGGLSVNVSSNVGIGVLSAATRLDVQARSGDTYSQIWRNAAGVIQASMTATGIIYADASRMVNLPSGGDSFGNHTATQVVNMGGYQLLNVSSVTVAGASGLGAARLYLSSNVELSSETSSSLGAGLRVSTNVYVVGFSSAAKYYGDGSALTGVISSPDGMGNHTAVQNLNMAGYNVVGVSSITSSGTGVVFSTHVLVMGGNLGVNKSLPQASLDVNGNIMSSSLSGFGDQCVYADNTGRLILSGGGLCGSAAGTDNLGNRIMLGNLITGSNWISFDGSNGGLSVNVSSNVGIGVLSAATRLDVQGRSGDAYVQIWRNSAGVIQASMSASGLLFSDASQMRNLPSGADNLGNHTATTNLNLASFDITSVATMTVGYLTSSGRGVVFSTSMLLMDGNLGINTYFPQEKLHVNGNILASNLVGAGNRCAYVDSNGVLRAKGSDCGTAAGAADDLGSHVMLQNLLTGSNWIGNDGGNEGIRVDAVGNVSIGGLITDVAAGRFDVQGAAGTPIQVWRDNNGVVRASMSSGGGLAASSATVNGQLTVNSSATVTSASGVGSARLRLSSNVEISSAASASLGGGVRISSNVYIVGYSSAAKYYGDGSGLTGVSGSDNLGDHIATQSLDLNTFNLVNVASLTARGAVTSYSSFTIAGELGLGAALRFAGNVNISSATGLYGGIFISTNVNLVAGAKYYVNGVEVSGGGGNVEDTLAATLAAGNDAGGNNIANAGAVSAASIGAAKLGLNPGVELSSTTADKRGGVYVSTNVFLPPGARYYGDGSPLTGLNASNINSGTLSDARLSANVPLLNGSQTFTGDNIFSSNASFTAQSGSLPGVSVSSGLVVLNGDVGIGTSSPQAKLDVNGGIRLGNTANPAAGTIRYSGSGFEGYNGGWQTLNGSYSVENSTALWGVTTDTVYTVGSSSNVAIGTMNAGISKLRVTGSGNTSAANAFLAENLSASPLFTVRNDGNVSVGPQTPGTRLDVQPAGGDTYSQFWRNSAGIIKATMTAAGVLYADGSQLSNLPTDTLSSTLGAGNDAGGLNVVNAGAITANGQVTTYSSATVAGALGVGAARLRLSSNVEISSETSASLGAGVRISSNVYIVGFSSAAKYYGDGSALTGISGSGGLGTHIATQDLNLAGFSLVNTSVITGAAGAAVSFSTSVLIGGNIGASGGAVFSGGPVGIGTNFPLTSLHISSAAGYAGSMVIISTGIAPVITMTGAGEIYAARFFGDGSALTGVAGGGSLSSILAVSGNAGNRYIVSLSSLAIGRATSDAPLDIQAVVGNPRVQLWRNEAGLIVATMTAGGVLEANGAVINTVEISSRLSVGNQASVDLSVITMIMGIFEDAEITGMNTGVGGISLVNPATNKSAGEVVIGGNFYSGIPLGPGVTANFPTLIGLRAATLANTSGVVKEAYGLYVRNEQTAGTVTDNYGVYVASPGVSAGTMTNNYGLYVRDHSLAPAVSSYNIYSAGAGSVNRFEGAVRVDGALRLASKTKAQILLLDPVEAGEMYYCSDCTPKTMVVSTGTAVGNFANGAGGSF